MLRVLKRRNNESSSLHPPVSLQLTPQDTRLTHGRFVALGFRVARRRTDEAGRPAPCRRRSYTCPVVMTELYVINDAWGSR